MPGAKTVVEAAGREVTVSNPDKVFFPRTGHTKIDLVRYYLAVADGAVRGVAQRPMALKRFVNGAEGEPFFQKRAPESRPDWIETVELRFPSGRTASEVVASDAAQLIWVVNLGCIDLNPHPVRAGDLDHPDELRVDLDPVPGVEWPQIMDVALVAKSVLEDFGLTAWPKTSGSRGFHIYARIEPRWPFTDVRRAAVALAREVERRAPDIATSKWWKEERHGVFVDYNQNAKDRTVASAYSIRPLPDARVSTPLSWDEVAGVIRPPSRSAPCRPGLPRWVIHGPGWTRPPARSAGCSNWPNGTRSRACPTPRGRRISSASPGRSRASSRPSAGRRGRRRPRGALRQAVPGVPVPGALNLGRTRRRRRRGTRTRTGPRRRTRTGPQPGRTQPGAHPGHAPGAAGRPGGGSPKCR